MPQKADPIPFEPDHIISEQHGGPTAMPNLALSCRYCNRFKGPNLAGVDPVTRRIVPLFNPRRNRWKAHFRWVGPRVVGLTPLGRATVIVLRMNSERSVELRAALVDEGAFPPEVRGRR
jgi:hypothetical protein